MKACLMIGIDTCYFPEANIEEETTIGMTRLALACDVQSDNQVILR
jgi:hypothetical protein